MLLPSLFALFKLRTIRCMEGVFDCHRFCIGSFDVSRILPHMSIGRHDRAGYDRRRIPHVVLMPVSRSVATYTVKIRTGSLRSPEERSVIRILTGE